MIKKIKRYVLDKSGIAILLSRSEEQIKLANDILNAHKFNQAIAEVEWVKYKSFFPGRWAVDYTFFLNLFRILNHRKYQNILEFGLGQTSKMVHQYASFYQTHAQTVEHDSEWVQFFKDEIKNAYAVNIRPVPLEMVRYKNLETRSYKNIESLFGEEKFDFILVDGPFGSEHYSRSQIIHLAEYNLADTFCIMLDDCQREGEKETLNEILEVLKRKKINASHTIYDGVKSHAVVCSEDLKFFTSF